MNFALMLATLVALAAVVHGYPRNDRYVRNGYIRGAGRNALRRGVEDVVGQGAYNLGSGIGRLASSRIVGAGLAVARDGLIRGAIGGRRGRGFVDDVYYRPRGSVYGAYGGRRGGARISVGGRVSGVIGGY